MPDNPARQTGHEAIGRIVVGVINGRIKLPLGGWVWQAGEELQDFVLVSRSRRGDTTLLQHPGGGLQWEDRVLGQVADRRPVCGGTPADNGPRGTDFDRLHSL